MGLSGPGTPEIYMPIFCVDVLTRFARENVSPGSQKGQ